ncbi:MAG TPA: hypothetical protein VGH83_05625 [Candidatus Acidoferrum sp.]|jgi:hypothetical protein
MNTGPLTRGHYVQIGIGIGFYVPEDAFQCVQSIANETGQTQFLGVTKDGRALHTSRDELLAQPDLAGGIAWIVPQGGPQ